MIEKPMYFNMDSEGYKEAKKYLISMEEYDTFLNNRTSVDGYSLIATANSIFEDNYEPIGWEVGQ